MLVSVYLNGLITDLGPFKALGSLSAPSIRRRRGVHILVFCIKSPGYLFALMNWIKNPFAYIYLLWRRNTAANIKHCIGRHCKDNFFGGVVVNRSKKRATLQSDGLSKWVNEWRIKFREELCAFSFVGRFYLPHDRGVWHPWRYLPTFDPPPAPAR